MDFMPKTTTSNPNILLVSIDSLRADHLSVYGYKKETSPYLDGLAMDGMLFENAITAANWTGAAVASLLTGLYPTCHGYTNARYYLDADVESIATLLQKNGYFTICFSNNMYISASTGLNQGFTDFRYQGKLEKMPDAAESKKPKTPASLMKAMLSPRTKSLLKDVLDSFQIRKRLSRDDGAFRTEVSFIDWLAHYQGTDPFFAYIHYQEPHSIYFPPFPFRRRFFTGSWVEESAYLHYDHIGFFAGKHSFTEEQIEHYQQLYDGEIAYLDWRLGRLFDFLRQKKVFDRTMIIVTADHGECMGENGYFWHAFCLYDPLIRVPLIVHYPEWFSKASRVTKIVQSNDIVPTILEGLGIEWRHQGEGQGQSFLHGPRRTAALTETDNPEKMVARWLKRRTDVREEDFRHYLRDLTSYRTVDEKLIRASDGFHEFYDLVADPQESHNAYAASGKRIKAAEKALREWHGTFRPHVADSHQPGFDKDTWEKMKSLGYA